jgi:uroporphyrinogen decarboxylase
METMTCRERFLAACACREVDRPPLWIMRQAGRHLPEYRRLRERHSFASLVHEPELAAAVTMQPVRRYGFDAAIVFCDILALPEAMGQGYRLREGEGITMNYAVRNAAQVRELVDEPALLRERLRYVANALKLVRGELGDTRALIGFSGSPWTLACYMAEGAGPGASGFAAWLAIVREAPALANELLEKLTGAVAEYLRMQIEAGADAVQIFDSWGGACPPGDYERLSLARMQQVLDRLPTGFPTIVFAKGAMGKARAIAAAGARVVGADWSIPLRELADSLPASVAVQGNLAPALMDGEPQAVADAARRLLDSMKGRPGHIVNLGHGISPEAKVECVEELVNAVRTERIVT